MNPEDKTPTPEAQPMQPPAQPEPAAAPEAPPKEDVNPSPQPATTTMAGSGSANPAMALAKKLNTKITVVIVALVLILGAAAWFYMQKGSVKLSEFKSTEIGISIKRPADWKAGDASSTTASFYKEGENVTGINDTDAGMVVSRTPGTSDQAQRDKVVNLLKESLSKSFGSDSTKITEKDITLSGIKGRDLFFKAAKLKDDKASGSARVVILYDNDYFYLIVFAATDAQYAKYTKSVDKIFNSFTKL